MEYNNNEEEYWIKWERLSKLKISVPREMIVNIKKSDCILINKRVILMSILMLPFFELDGLWAITGKAIRYGWGLLGLLIFAYFIIGKQEKICLDKI